MYGSKTVHKRFAINSYDFALWKKLLERSKRLAVIGIIESWNQDCSVSNVKVRITCWQPAVFGVDSSWHLNCFDIEFPSVLISCTQEKFIVFVQHLVILILAIFLNHAHNRVFTHEPCNVVNMTICVVSYDTRVEPDQVRHSQIVSQMLGYLARALLWVPVLVEQTLLCGQASAEAVDIDGPTFQDNSRFEYLKTCR